MKDTNKKIEETMKRSGYDREQIDEALTKATLKFPSQALTFKGVGYTCVSFYLTNTDLTLEFDVVNITG